MELRLLKFKIGKRQAEMQQPFTENIERIREGEMGWFHIPDILYKREDVACVSRA